MSHTPYAETLVNTYTTGEQFAEAVISLPDGGWVVTWLSQGQDRLDQPDGYGVYQQAYNADGTSKGDETRVNTFTTGNQIFESITSLSDGGWVVTWDGTADDDNPARSEIYQQRYHADGSTNGGEVLVNSYTTGQQIHSATAALADGGWVVTWQGPGYGGDEGISVYQQRYDDNGARVDIETRVNSSATGNQNGADVAAIGDGGWVVIWTSNGQDGDRYGIYQQAYDANGATMGDETRVNTYTAGNQYNPSLTELKDGGWVVAWSSENQDGDSNGVYQQRYDADGATVGGETRVNTYTTGDQTPYFTTALTNGGWVVTWDSRGQDGDSEGVYQQAYNADGVALGSETRVNTYTTAVQRPNAVTALSDGGWVEIWQSDQDGDGNGIYQQAYSADGTARGEETRVNTTTAGNQTFSFATALADGGWLVAWSSAGQDGDSYGVYQQRYDAEGQIYGSNHAPTAAGSTITSLTNGAYAFSKAAFGFSDGTDGDSLASVVITALPMHGKLLLDGAAVTNGQEIAAADLGHLVWQAGKHALSASIHFKVVDDGGTEAGGKDTSEVQTVSFAITSDTFTGTKAAEKLVGTDGHDILIGKGGNDRLTGGAAADSFVFATGDGKDKVTDFHHEQGDKLDLSAVDTIASYKDLIRHHISMHDNDLRITDDTGDMIILKHTSAGELHKGDFIF